MIRQIRVRDSEFGAGRAEIVLPLNPVVQIGEIEKIYNFLP